jgi:hypothetical protein
VGDEPGTRKKLRDIFLAVEDRLRRTEDLNATRHRRHSAKKLKTTPQECETRLIPLDGGKWH